MIRRFSKSLGYAVAGLRFLIRTQPNFRIHLVVATLVVGAGAYLRLDPLAWGLLIFAIGMVLCSEALNTAIEALVDLSSPESHPLAGTAKDVAAAAVLLSALTAIGIGLCVLGPPLWSRWAD